MKKILLLSLMSFLCVGAFAASTQLFKPENVYKYDLKNLESDLKKDAGLPDFFSATPSKEISASNRYQLSTNNDADVKAFISALKNKKYSVAADLINKHKYNSDIAAEQTHVQFMFPLVLGNANMVDYGAIPFYEGVLGLQQVGQDTDVKFYYMTIKGNVLYMFKMNGSLGRDNIWDAKKANTVEKMSITDGMKIFKIPATCTYTSDKFQRKDCNTNRFLQYLQKKAKSKELDERQNAFKKKVLKLFK